jgi:heterodisulfide reductase subunit A-like polyferredoxin
LIYGVNEAILVQKKIDGAEITFISPEMEAFKTSVGADLEKVSGVNFVNGTVAEVTEEPGENKNIEVKYEAGGEKTETFDLVVLLTQPQLPPAVEGAAKQLGLEVTYANFLAKPGEMVETDKPGVVLAQNA